MNRSPAAAWAAALLCVSFGTGHARPITLPEALALVERSPALALAASDIEVARGQLAQATSHRYNPAIAASGGPVFGGGGRAYDLEIGISQPLEIGKRAARGKVAAAERDAAVERLAAVRIAVRAEVRRAYQAALVAQARIGVATGNEAWGRQFAEAARERLRLGAATQTEVNVAAAALGRAIAEHKSADRDLLLARQALAEALGVPGVELEPAGGLPTFAAVPGDPAHEQAAVRSGLAARRDLAAAQRVREARAAEVELADALAIPDPELTASWIHAGIEDSDALIAGVRIELPLWNRLRGDRAVARAGRRRAAIEAEALHSAVDREVRGALRRYRAAVEAVAAFNQQVVGRLDENLTLARETLAAGKLGLLDINNVRRDLVESQRAYLDAIAEAVEAQAVLERALGGAPEVAR